MITTLTWLFLVPKLEELFMLWTKHVTNTSRLEPPLAQKLESLLGEAGLTAAVHASDVYEPFIPPRSLLTMVHILFCRLSSEIYQLTITTGTLLALSLAGDIQLSLWDHSYLQTFWQYLCAFSEPHHWISFVDPVGHQNLRLAMSALHANTRRQTAVFPRV